MPQIGIQAAAGNEVVMGSHLTNPTSAIDDDYLIRRTNGVELVGDNDDCRRLPQLGHSGLDMGLVLRVQSRGVGTMS